MATKSSDPTPDVDPEVVAEEGYYAAAESGDNSIDVSNEAYIGVDPEYRNHADVSTEPFLSEDEDVREVEEQAIENEKERQTDVGIHGYTPYEVDPSDPETTGSSTTFNVPEPKPEAENVPEKPAPSPLS